MDDLFIVVLHVCSGVGVVVVRYIACPISCTFNTTVIVMHILYTVVVTKALLIVTSLSLDLLSVM